jgi:tetratricopeptide (TPR) repeat protein
MPAHIYQRVGDFSKAAKHNRDAADVDADYALKYKMPGRYVAYYIHNLDFLAYSHSMGGRAQDALATARELSEVIATHRPKFRSAVCPSAPLVVADLLVRFHRWDDVLKASPPAPDDMAGRLFDTYARGMAHVARGNLPEAEKALQAIDTAGPAAAEAFATTTAGTPYAKAGPLLIRAAKSVLAAKIAQARNDAAAAELHLRAGIEAEDALPYAEPAMWRSPIRESLGGMLLRAGKAAEAEAVFREDLKRNRGNGRSLFGLWKSLEKQNRPAEAAEAERQFRQAWGRADLELTVEKL